MMNNSVFVFSYGLTHTQISKERNSLWLVHAVFLPLDLSQFFVKHVFINITALAGFAMD